jgi:putative adhesin
LNSHSRVLYSLLLVTLVGCVALEERTARIDRKWSAAPIRRIEVRELNGTISVEGTTTSEIAMSAMVHARGIQPKPKEENQGYFQTEVDGDTLVIRRREYGHFHFFGTREVRVDYNLRVPPTLDLELRTVNGRIETRGIAGETAATTVNGEVDIENTGSNEVSAKTVNGRVQARFTNDFHGAHLGVVNGRVVVILPPTASFLGDFTQVNGDFEAAFPLNIHSHPGSRRVSGEVNGGRYSLKITTVNGDIKIDNGAGRAAPPPTPPPPPPPPALPRT